MRSIVLLLAACGGPPADETPDLPECGEEAVLAVPVHRLSRREYDNTVRDLLGMDLTLAEAFPPDETAHGFDNISAAQAVSPLLVEQYETAAARIAGAILEQADTRVQWEVEDLDGLPPGEVAQPLAEGSTWWLFEDSWNTVELPFDAPADGTYRLTVRALWGWGWQGGDLSGAPTLTVELDDRKLGELVVDSWTEPDRLEVEATLAEGPATFEITWCCGTGGVALDWMAIEGPVDRPDLLDSPARRTWLTCDPEDVGELPCAREVLGKLARRAWRRPIAEEELTALTELVSMGLDEDLEFEEALDLGLQAVFLSPWFLYLVEDTSADDPGAVRNLSPLELASRLSYFLWSTTPDEELLTCAEREDGLRPSSALPPGDPCSLQVQVQRMMADPRADVLISDFAHQWLQLASLDDMWRDPDIYPDYEPSLAASMREETVRFLQDHFENERPISNLFDGTTTWVDARLAALYGLPAPSGEGFVEVELDGDQRGGLLRQASILALNSHPNRSSPVQRGVWVLGRILCDAPPPAPPGIPSLDEEEAEATTLREVMEQHRADPFCASCHDDIDPIGLAFENYDALGAWREDVGGDPIDAAGTLPDGRSFQALPGLIEHLRDDPRTDLCVAEQLYPWALARGAEDEDACELDRMLASAEPSGGAMLDLVRAITEAAPFLKRRAPEDP